MTTKIRYRASNKTTIANAYKISTYTLQKWLAPINDELGEYLGKIYTPKQVAIIVNHFGEPEYIHIISAKKL